MSNFVYIALFASSLIAASAQAAESVYCDRVALRAAEVEVISAEARYHVARAGQAQLRAAYLYTLAEAQLEAACALCTEIPGKERAERWDAEDLTDRKGDPFADDLPDAFDVYGMREPVVVPGLPYLLDSIVERECPGGALCPVVVVARP